MSVWRHAICERCWIAREGTYAADEEGQRLISVRQPVVVRSSEGEDPLPVQRCCFCSFPTIFGVFVREDPTKTRYCQHE